MLCHFVGGELGSGVEPGVTSDVAQGATERWQEHENPVKQVFQVWRDARVNHRPFGPKLMIGKNSTCKKHVVTDLDVEVLTEIHIFAHLLISDTYNYV